MAHVVRMQVAIEVDGARYVFRFVDEIFTRMFDLARRLGDEFEESQECLDLMCDMFVRCVIGWEGVVDEEGAPIPCNEENRRGFPTEEKLQICSAYWQRRIEIEEKGGLPPGPPIDTTPSSTSTSEA